MTKPTPILFIIILLGFSFLCSHAEAATPVIYNCVPQSLQQGQITTAVITGENLNSTVVGVSGGDVYALILKQDPGGMSLTIQFATRPTAEPGERELYLRNASNEVEKYLIKIIPSSAPVVEGISPGFTTPGSTLLLYLTGMGLTDSIVSTASNDILINSYRGSPDGTLIYLSVSISKETQPGTYQFYVSAPGGQSQADLVVASTVKEEDSSSYSDPYSPGIYSIERNPSNSDQVVLRGAMFDVDPSKNTVTLFENNDGVLIGRQVEVLSSSQNELIINLPEGLKSDSISFAVSNTDGKSSNIKTFTSSSETQTSTNAPELDSESANSLPGESQETTASSAGPQATSVSNTVQASNTNTANAQGASSPPVEQATATAQSPQQDPGKTPSAIAPSPTTTVTDKNIEAIAEVNIAQNIKNLNPYLFANNANQDSKIETKFNSNEMKDPAKILSSIEESKQIKTQVDLIMLALDQSKGNEELSNAAKKAEGLKSKVEELERVIELEKQKNKPNQRKLVKYQELLASASAESRSQTFALLNNLLKYKPQLKNLLTQKPFDLAAIQPSIPNNTAVIQYVPTEEGLIIFVVDSKNLKTRINKSITKDILNKEVQEYRQLFEKEIDRIKVTGRVTPIVSWKDDKSITYKKEILPLKEKNILLYNALIAPIEKDIANKTVLAIIANGWLTYLPFQALAKPTKEGDLKFLISEKSIVSLDSVIALNKTIPASISGMSNVTIFANPDNSLPGANKEAELISKVYSMSTMSFVQQPFTVSIINQLAKKADILHLATHGHLDGSDINASYLVIGKKLEKGKTLQKKLWLKDIYDLNLENSKLVVLSGCDTGKIGNLSSEPDDIVGSLASAFRVAGANTILASLWKAHDEATKIIMQNFYENLKLGYNKAESLRRAELKLKENPKYSHPLFWSLFTLIGDWR
jgi:CHAT domain-containing protein